MSVQRTPLDVDGRKRGSSQVATTVVARPTERKDGPETGKRPPSRPAGARLASPLPHDPSRPTMNCSLAVGAKYSVHVNG